MKRLNISRTAVKDAKGYGKDMPITMRDTPGAVKRLRGLLKQRHQCTFKTPIHQARPFAYAILTALQPIEEGEVTIDEVVFEPMKLNALLARNGTSAKVLAGEKMRNSTFACRGQAELAELLGAFMGEWIDFLFLPNPPLFALYVDHDEYTTLFSAKKSHVQQLSRSLAELGHHEISHYRREL